MLSKYCLDCLRLTNWKTLFFLLIMISYASQSYALRCGNKLVEINDRKHAVLRKCGEPTYTDSYIQAISPYRPHHTQQIDVWTYNFGSNRFMQELLFRNGRLYRINDLDYGY